MDNHNPKMKYRIFSIAFAIGIFTIGWVPSQPVFGAPTTNSMTQIGISASLFNDQNQVINNGSYDIRFTIYTTDRKTSDPYPSNKDARIWEETQKVDVKSGLIKTFLGSVVPFPATLNFQTGDYYVGIRIGTDSEMVPRKKLGSVPSAINAQFLRGKTIGINKGDIPVIASTGTLDVAILNKINQVGTIKKGAWQGTAIADSYIANALTGKTYNGINLITTTGNHTLTLSTDIILDQNLSLTSDVVFNTLSLVNALTVENGGTGIATIPTDGQLLIGNGTNYTLATLTAGTGMTVSNSPGAITLTNAGVTSLIGTTDQIIISGGTGDITLSLPQNIATTSSPTFSSLTLSNALTVGNGGTNTTAIGSAGSIAYSTGTAYSFSAVGTSGQALLSGATGSPTWGLIGGAGITADSLDFTEFKDAMTLDASTDIALNSFNFSFSGTGNVGIGDITPASLLSVGSTSQFQVNSTGAITATTGITSSGLLSFTGTNHAGLRVNNLTTTQRDSLTPTAGMTIFNTTVTKMQVYNGSVWKNVGNPEIGAEVTSGTPGSALFVDASGNLGQDNANFFWDDMNNRLGIGTTVPQGRLSIAGGDVYIDASDQNAGTLPNSLVGYGLRFGAFGTGEGIASNRTVTGIENNQYGLDFYTSYLKRISITINGNVGIGTTNPTSMFSVGATSQFQVDSTGAIAGATGITSSGTITFSGLSPAGIVTNTAGGVLNTTISVPIGNGGTNATSVGNAGSIAYSTGTAYSFSAVGTSGQALLSGASGSPTWGLIGSAGITPNSLDFTEFKDAMTLDASTDISVTGTNVFSITNTGTGNSFLVNDQSADTTPFVIDASGNVGIGTATPSSLLSIGTTNTSGVLLNVSYTGNATLTGALTGAKIDLNDGFVTPTNQSVTGIHVVLPTTTNTNLVGTTVTMDGMLFGFGAGTGINQNGAGTTIYSGANLLMPALTQTLGTLIANGALITTPSSITTGGTANGINISATGVGAGSLSGVNISSITGSSGTEMALNIGSGWDSVLSVNGTQVINGSGVVQVAAGGTGITSYSAGDIIYASGTTAFIALNGGVSNNGKVLTISGGVPAWGVMSGSSCTDCVVNNPTSSTTQTIAPTGQSTSALILRQTSTASPNTNIFEVASSDGVTKYFYVDQNGNVSTGGIASQSITLTPTSDIAALTLVGTNVPTANLEYINAKNTQGTIFNMAYGTPATLGGALIGESLNLATNVTATDQSVTGLSVTLPDATNTTSTSVYKGLSVSLPGGSGINQNGAGSSNFSGLNVTMPALTQTAGTLTASGALITTPVSITTDGTAYGVNIVSAGVGAGTLYGLNVGNITAGAGTERAINIGTGWDYGVYSATTGNSYFAGNVGIGDTTPASLLTVGNGDLFQVDSTGAIAAATGITSSGTVTLSGLSPAGIVTNTAGGLLGTTLYVPVGNGGTGAGTFTANGVLYGNGASTLQATGAGTDAQFLIANGSGVPTFVSMSNDATIANTGALTLATVNNNIGSFNTVTVNAKGLITGASNATYLTSAANVSLSNLSSVAINTDLVGAVTGGMGIRGGSTANDDLILEGTTNATRTSSYVILQPNGGNVGIGTAAPSAMLDIYGPSNALRLSYNASNYISMASSSVGDLSFTSSSTTESALIVGNNTAQNVSVIFDNLTQDYYAGIDNTDSVFKIGGGQTIGTNPFLSVNSTGNVGIGTTGPGALLSVSGGVGIGSTYAGTAVSDGNVIISGNVGIGTTNPTANLEVNGIVKITGGTPGANKVLTSDVNGLASWGTVSNLTADYTVDSGSASINVGDIVAYINGNATKSVAATVGTPVAANAVASTYTSAAALDSTHFVVAYRNSSGYATAVIGTVGLSGTTITYGTPVALNAVASTYTSAAALDSTHFVVAYAGTSTYATAVVGTVTDGTNTIATVGTPVALNAVASTYTSAAALDSTHFVVAYVAGTFATVIASTVSGTTITKGTPVALNAVASTYTSAAALDSTHFVVAYTVGANTSVTAVVSTLSGTTIAIGTPVSLYGSGGTYISVVDLDPMRFVVAFRDNNSTFVNAIVSAVSGTIITAGNRVALNAVASTYTSATPLDSTHFVVAYSGASSYANAIVSTVSGTTIATVGTPVALNAVASASTSVATLFSNGFVVAYQNTSTTYANAVVSAGSSNNLGMATNVASAGGTVTVASNGVVTGLSGLTAGSTYYWSVDTGLTTTTQTYKVGIALTTTSMLLNSGSGAGADQYFGDMIFANNFRITEGEDPNSLIFKNQLGRDILTIDETGMLTASILKANSLEIGGDKFYINDTGNVGIGTTGPGALLSVSGGVGIGSTYAGTAVSDGNVIVSGNVGIGTTSPTAMLQIGTSLAGGNVRIDNGWLCVDNNGTCTGATTAGTIYAVGAYTTGADYAEYFYTKDTDLKPGEAVCIDSETENAVKRCQNNGDNNIMGIVSSNPSIVGNKNHPNDDHYKIIGMLGQVSGEVSNENGDIKVGDSLTAGLVPGQMRKANAGESTVGIALQNFSDASGSIQILISRRNQSLTVEKVEQAVTDNITAMNIDDQVNALVSNAKIALDTQITNQSTVLTLQAQNIISLQNDIALLRSDGDTERDTIALLQSQMDLIKTQNQSVIDFMLTLNMDTLVYKDVLGNLDIGTGKFTAKDIEALGTIKAQDIEATNSLKGANLELGNTVSGTNVVSTGELESVIILTTEAKVGMKLYITPKGSTGGKTLYYDETDIIEGVSFKVKIDAPALDKDVEFNWLIVK